jgi:hypothetical protein
MISTTQHTAPEIPDHELLRPVGQGSYGEVWLARTVTGSFRAVKVVRRAAFPDARPYEREFNGLQKFEPISRSHPGLVNILHIGRNQAGEFFYSVMEVADDVMLGQAVDPEAYLPRTLANEIARRGRLPVEECIELGVRLAGALEYLHGSGLVHRDIKPSNIIFVNRVPKLADIGLVTRIGTKATFVGTEGFLAPEGPGSPAADQYSLGKVLYEMSTGKGVDQFPELPTNLHGSPEALLWMRFNEVVLRACELQPAKRFRSVAELKTTIDGLRQSAWGGAARALAMGEEPVGCGSAVVVLVAADGSPEASLASDLKRQLIEAGLSVYLDPTEGIERSWARGMEQAIRNADSVVVLLSPGALRSLDLAYALELVHQEAQHSERPPRIVAVRSPAAATLPRHFAMALENAQFLTLEKRVDRAKFFNDMLLALGLSAIGTAG